MKDLYGPLTILQLVCKKLGLKYEVVDRASQTMVEVSNGSQHFFASIGKLGVYPLNSHFASALALDKAWTSLVLSQAGFKVPQGEAFFLTNDWKEYRPPGKEQSDALAYAQKIGYPVFVKPNGASSGLLAEVITSESELSAHLEKVKKVDPIVLIQKIITGDEFRIFVVDQTAEFMYRRTAAEIVGDGVKTIEQLFADLNRTIPLAVHQLAVDTPLVQFQLNQQQLQASNVLPHHQKIKVAAHANLVSGGQIADYQEEIPAAIKKWAVAVAQTLGLRVCGIDVFADSISNANTAEWTIIEVNSNPNLTGIYEVGHQETVERIWTKILTQFFVTTEGK